MGIEICQVPVRLSYHNLSLGLSQLAFPFDPKQRGDSVVLNFEGHEFSDPAGTVALAGFGAHYYRTTRKRVELGAWRPDGYLSRVRLQEFCHHKDDYPQSRRDAGDRFTEITEVVVAKHRVSASEHAMNVLGIDDEGARDLVFYCLEEMLRNVEEHAESPVNALLQAQYYPESKEIVFAIADTGRGILHSLRQRNQDLADDEEALRHALRPRVSGRNIRRSSVENAGVGLTVTNRLVTQLGGRFQIASGNCVLEVTPSGIVAHKLTSGVWQGVLVTLVMPIEANRDWGKVLVDVLGEI